MSPFTTEVTKVRYLKLYETGTGNIVSHHLQELYKKCDFPPFMRRVWDIRQYRKNWRNSRWAKQCASAESFLKTIMNNREHNTASRTEVSHYAHAPCIAPTDCKCSYTRKKRQMKWVNNATGTTPCHTSGLLPEFPSGTSRTAAQGWPWYCPSNSTKKCHRNEQYSWEIKMSHKACFVISYMTTSDRFLCFFLVLDTTYRSKHITDSIKVGINIVKYQ